MRMLTVNPDYKRMVPRPSVEDLHALEANIVAKGEAIVPIIVNKEGVILDGHTRYDICTRNGCYYTTTVREFSTLLEGEK